jgi:hypothetical protein
VKNIKNLPDSKMSQNPTLFPDTVCLRHVQCTLVFYILRLSCFVRHEGYFCTFGPKFQRPGNTDVNDTNCMAVAWWETGFVLHSFIAHAFQRYYHVPLGIHIYEHLNVTITVRAMKQETSKHYNCNLLKSKSKHICLAHFLV